MLAGDLWKSLKESGALVASIVALAIAISPALWKYWRRPRLAIHVAESEPHVRVARTEDDNVRRTWLRMEVVNEGRGVEARRVRAFLHEWYERPDESSQWERRDIDPSALHWVSMSHKNTSLAREPAVNLPRGLWAFVDLIVYTRTSNEQQLILDDPTPRGFGSRPTYNTGEFVLTVTVAAENAQPETRHVHYSLSKDRLFYDVRLDKSAPAGARFMGLLTEAKQLRPPTDSS